MSEAGRGATESPVDEDRLDGWKLEGLDFPSFRISLLAKVMDRLTNRTLAENSEISITEWRVLTRLTLLPEGLTVRQIAMRAWVDRAEVSRAASSLEARGLISRRENPADRRSPILTVTPAGKKLYKPIMKLRTAFHARIMQNLSGQEIEQLDELLTKLAHNLLEMTDES